MISLHPDASVPNQPGVVAKIVAKVLATGADEFEVECKNGKEEICALKGPLGFGVASLGSSSEEAKELRAQLYAVRKIRKISVQGVEYVLRVEVLDSFGEDAFRVKVTPTEE